MANTDLNLVLLYVQSIYPNEEVSGIQRIKTPNRNRFLITYCDRTYTIEVEYNKQQRPSFVHIY